MSEPDAPVDYSVYYRNWHTDTPEHAADMTNHHVAQLAPLLQGVPRGKAVDIGCGMGFAVVAAARLGFEAVGLERDDGQVDACRRLAVPVVQTDREREWLEARGGQHELVTLLDVLEHVDRTEQIPLLRAARHSLTPSGVAVLTVPNATSPLASHWLHQDWTHTTAFTMHSIRFVLINAGFRDVWIQPPDPVDIRPPLRLYRSDHRALARKWLLRRLWRAVLRAELGPVPEAEAPLDLNLTVVARP